MATTYKQQSFFYLLNALLDEAMLSKIGNGMCEMQPAGVLLPMKKKRFIKVICSLIDKTSIKV